MSRYPNAEPRGVEGASGALDLVFEARARDLGGFSVRRTLPARERRLVGPFVFFDHIGPVDFPPGVGIDVRPHPHIGLATITYLFDGAFVHRDSLGSRQTIRPGDVNWMIAGRGIVHSERTAEDVRASGGRLHGLQTWVALLRRDEETEPRFEHHEASAMPVVKRPGVVLRLVAGTAFGVRAPTAVLSPTLYVHGQIDRGAELPLDDEHEERAAYVVSGRVACEGRTFDPGAMLVFRPREKVRLVAAEDAHVMLIGGSPMDGPRFIDWNFVASARERIDRAKDDWRQGRFPKVPGDDVEFIPLPE